MLLIYFIVVMDALLNGRALIFFDCSQQQVIVEQWCQPYGACPLWKTRYLTNYGYYKDTYKWTYKVVHSKSRGAEPRLPVGTNIGDVSRTPVVHLLHIKAKHIHTNHFIHTCVCVEGLWEVEITIHRNVPVTLPPCASYSFLINLSIDQIYLIYSNMNLK